MALGDNQTPYLHLNLGTDEAKNRNWAVLDRRIYDVARGLFANIPAGGDLLGFYPDPTIRPGAVVPTSLAPNPPVGGVPIVQAGGTFAWLTGIPPSGAAGGDLTGNYPNPSLSVIQSSKVQLAGRGAFFSGPGGASIGVNDPQHDPAYVATSPSWVANYLDGLGSDEANISRRPANGAAGAFTKLLTINANGTIRVTTDPVNALDLATRQFVLANVGGGGPPTGPAGGGLQGTYPNPSINPAALPTTLPPNGPAGGSLAGTYPNPSIAPGAVGDTQITAVAWSKVTGAPTAFPPSGAATGDLTGSYPAPTLAAALRAQATLWTAGTAPALSPTAANSTLVLAGSNVAGTTVGEAIRFGATTVKGRLLQSGASAQLFTANFNWNGTAWGSDDASLSSWRLNLNPTTDVATIERAAAGAPTVSQVVASFQSSGLFLNAIDGSNGNLFLTSAGTNGGANFVGRQSRGTVAAPTPTLNGDIPCALSAFGCTANGVLNQTGLLRWVATENWSATARGSACYIFTTTATTNTLVQAAMFAGNGDLTIAGPNATKAAGTSWINPSDARLKKNIVDYSTGLAAIIALRPVSFNYNGLGGTTDDGILYQGLIADEVQVAMPECVQTRPARLHPDDEADTDLLMLDTSDITLALINAVKELSSRVAALEARP